MEQYAERVVVLGGTFDPPHVGHIGAAKDLLRRFSLVVFAPTAQNPFKGRIPTPLSDRVQMLNLIAKAHSLPLTCDAKGRGVFVDDFSYERTYQFVEHWRQEHGESVAWAIGPDLREEVHKWERWPEMNLTLIEVPEFGDGSLRSEEIRAGQTPLDPSLLSYVREHRLYR